LALPSAHEKIEPARPIHLSIIQVCIDLKSVLSVLRFELHMEEEYILGSKSESLALHPSKQRKHCLFVKKSNNIHIYIGAKPPRLWLIHFEELGTLW
jgi:hypothetical protein